MESIIQLITVLIIFIIILGITYLTTRWIGSFQRGQMTGANIELLEAVRLNQSQYLQLVRAGSKYVVLAVSKDSISVVCQLSEDEYDSDWKDKINTQSNVESFQKLFKEAGSKLRRR